MKDNKKSYENQKNAHPDQKRPEVQDPKKPNKLDPRKPAKPEQRKTPGRDDQHRDRK